MMNQYARAMGMTNTTFKNANGLTRDGHMSTARDMATLGRRLVYDFPQYYNIFGRTSTSAGLVDGEEHQPPDARGLSRRRRDQDRLHPGRGLQRRLLGAARQQAGDRGADGRQVDRRAQCRGGPSDGPRLRRDAGRRPGSAPPPPLRTTVASAAADRDRRRRGAPASRLPPRVVADAGDSAIAGRSAPAGRPLPRALDAEAITRNSATIAAAIAEVNAELDRGAGDPQRAGRPRWPPEPAGCRAAGGRAPGAPMAVDRRSAGSASTFAVGRRPRPRAAGRETSRADRARRRRHRAPPAATTGACSSAPSAPRATPSGSC